ncbi:hypothetical protein L1S34_07250 [Flavobacterium sp. K77]|uniref:Lipoprotein n=1 Tax=Flavobacterium difficile TaxID=2709659 RepID=A0ABX0I6P3_9FLAO|nr:MULTISPECIES: hypothetical protein [Flavobacterium]MCF6141077.1 hypothetical protein [Flavobacterium sp. K77]NHM02850.1 hypothetical protein [Flavobacterium difficile]
MRQLIFILIAYILFSCQHKERIKKSFVTFEFESWNLAENFILKYNGGDTIYLKSIFPEKENLFSVINENEKEDLLESLKESEFDYSKEYWNSSMEDGQTYKFNIIHLNRKKDSILIHEGKGPKKLYDLAEKFKKLIREKKFKKK